MDKLDENYLNLVRESLYKKKKPQVITKHVTTESKNSKKLKRKVGDNEESPKNKVIKEIITKKETFKAKARLQNSSKKKAKPKLVALIENTSKDQLDNNRPNEPSKEVKSRVATPFKKTEALIKLEAKNNSLNLNLSPDGKIVTTIDKQKSPSLKETESFSLKGIKKISNKKSKKRLLSEPDSPEEHVKRKKEKDFANKGKKLLFDDCLDSIELRKVLSGSPNVADNKKIVAKKKKVTNKSTEKIVETDFTLVPSLQNEAESSLNNTWEHFIHAHKNEKKKERTERPRKNVSNKKIIGNKTNDENQQNVDSIMLANSPKASNLVLENNLKQLVTDNITVEKKSNNKNGKQHKKIKKLKLNKKNLITESKKNTKLILDSSDSSSDIEFQPLKKSIRSMENCTEFSDCSDSEIVGVKGLKFQRFCNLFPPTHNQQFLGYNNTLSFPKKYFEVSENDFEPDCQCEEFLSLRDKTRGNLGTQEEKTSTSSKHEFESNSVCKEVYISKVPDLNLLDRTNKKKHQRENTNILNVQILDNISQDSVISVEDQETAKETSDSQEILIDPVSPKQPYEKAYHYSDKSQPIVLTLKNNNKIVALNWGEKIYFYGLCLLKVLNGELEIFGAKVNSSSAEKKLYSPRGTALVYIRNNCTLFVESLVKLKNLVSEEMLYEKDVNYTFNQHHAIFLCSELRETYMDFIERHVSQKIFPEISGLRLDFKLQGSLNRIQSAEKWEEILENIPEESKIVISGGKGVGKSTFLRYAVNFLLREFKKIRVLDLDPGQSEFYPPGCLSVVTLDKEVFGPNYTHLLQPDSLILSHINMGYDIEKYLKSVKLLLDSTKSMEVLPTLINFPGYTQGLGLGISAESLKMIEPSLVIQINSKSHSKNYIVDLTPENVNKILTVGSMLSQDDDKNDLSYDFIRLESLAENNEAWSLEARQGREINILSYFGKLMTDSVSDLTSADVNLYSINISALSIVNLEGKPISHLAINANLVALCSKLDKHSDFFFCYGYGFVRGMDFHTDTLVLITPETIETLENVTHLVLSSVTVPPSLIMTTHSVKGHVPYVNVGEPVDFGQFTKRSYLPPQKMKFV